MREILLVVLWLMVAAQVSSLPPQAPTISVPDQAPPIVKDKVKGSCDCTVTGWCTCITCTCRGTVILRYPVGHTHTCPACKTVWDHKANSGHDCLHCGTEQLYQDLTPKMVHILDPKSTKSAKTVSVDEGCATGG